MVNSQNSLSMKNLIFLVQVLNHKLHSLTNVNAFDPKENIIWPILGIAICK